MHSNKQIVSTRAAELDRIEREIRDIVASLWWPLKGMFWVAVYFYRVRDWIGR
jgi:hypothetical protein